MEKVDQKFRMKLSGEKYNSAWNACARKYGKSAFNTLSKEGDAAFDDFCAGFIAGQRYVARKPKTKKKGGR